MIRRNILSLRPMINTSAFKIQPKEGTQIPIGVAAKMSSEMRDEDEEMGIAGEMPSCGKGHRSSLVLQTFEGGAICLVCLSALLSDPSSPSHHVSYALSQVSAAFRSPSFLLGLRTVHPHFLVAPLVRALSSFDDEPLARQIIDLISDLCGDGGSGSISSDFISRISDVLSSGSLAWSRRQVHMVITLSSSFVCSDRTLIWLIEAKLLELLFSRVIFGDFQTQTPLLRSIRT